MLDYINGNKDALEKLYEQLQKPLYSFLFRYTRDEQLSMDIVQDTFEQLQKKKNYFDSTKGRVQSYLFQIAYRLMLNKLNRRKKWQSILPYLTPMTPLFTNDDQMTIQEALLKLPEKQRAVIILAYYHDLNQEDISSILSIPKGTVKSRLHTAILRLKELLKEDYL
ncbi:RNA polymerase sigma factor [Alkalihalobacillus trypoxylicola]|uniref:RNA polymerase subunit sigma-70 n=1 Tax=Alkalihalobacillus trypoxylicola TaxID=519424 RepID=A0A161PDP3_9BACI|nr:RNA polymerase sigma factor [Alkalihalobacillus trypoxylicola]KYG26108.1 RNA polymerase subunit sigma-70 [Alkalihalobacillus trypoxylicola]